ncbi:MAG: 4Fe-4S binding protein [Prevotellaceae bacterium]|nr:4Fe-4S binding protein [Prevotellaceae bacterium]
MFWKRKDLIANVIEDKCQNCEHCIRICRRRVLMTSMVNGKMATFVNRPDKCTGCGKCAMFCPEKAIELIERYA